MSLCIVVSSDYEVLKKSYCDAFGPSSVHRVSSKTALTLYMHHFATTIHDSLSEHTSPSKLRQTMSLDQIE